MPPIAPQYSAVYILPLVKKVLFATLCTLHGPRISARPMMFACDDALRNFYFVTHQGTDKVAEIQACSAGTVCVLSTSDKLDDYSETIAHGRLEVLSDFKHAQVQAALKLLGAKSAMLQALADSGSLGDYVVLRLETAEIAFRVYRDIIQNVPKTILRY